MYSARAVAAILGVSPARLRSYARSGVVAPTRDRQGRMQFTFEDLVVLRKAVGLVAERIPARRVCRALRMLRQRMPNGRAVSQLRLRSEGRHVVAADGQRQWHPDSGQTLFDFQDARNTGDGASVTPLQPGHPGTPAPAATLPSPRSLYDRAIKLEATAPEEARAAYRSALEQDPDLPEVHVNLGRLLHEAGDVYAALVHYRAALALRPADTTAAFNIGVALEDLGAKADAIAAYRRTLEQHPRNADAHYNLARLLEQEGRPDQAVRHLLLYRQLTKKR